MRTEHDNGGTGEDREAMYGKTEIVLCENNRELGQEAAMEVAARIKKLLFKKGEIRIVFSAGESQSSFCHALAEEVVDWDRIVCFNIDDFWDPAIPERFTCGYQTTKELYEKVKPKTVHLVRYNAEDADAECERFETLLREGPLDILCQGIGTSGHLALNEPGQARFDDSKWVRVVDVAEQSKKQLIEDPNFKDLGYIPEKGITMTIPAILAADHVYTMVPLGLKKGILTRLAELEYPDESLPASVLLIKSGTLFVDRDSSPDCWVE